MANERKAYRVTTPSGAGWVLRPRGRTAWTAFPIVADGTESEASSFRLSAGDVAALQFSGYKFEEVA